MIFTIHESIVLAVIDNNADTIEFLIDLSQQRKRGKLSIKCNKSICNRIIKLENIPSEVVNVFKLERDNFTFSKGIFSSIEEQLICQHNLYTQEESQTTKQINIENYQSNEGIQELVNRRCLLVEDEISDGTILSIILKWYLHRLGFNRTHQTNIDIRNGGGNRIHQIYTSFTDIDKVGVFAIVDNDKKSPDCLLGATPTQTIAAFGDGDYPENLKVLTVSEIENLIPLDMYLELANQSQIPLHTFLHFLEINSPDSIRYYDFKNSFKVGQLFIPNSSISNYWKPLFDNYECPIVQGKINDASNCANDKILNRWSSLIPLVINHIGSQPLSDIEIPAYLLNDWIDIGRWLLPKGICSKPIRL